MKKKLIKSTINLLQVIIALCLGIYFLLKGKYIGFLCCWCYINQTNIEVLRQKLTNKEKE